MNNSLWVLIYVVIGAFVAAAHGYFGHISTLGGVISAILGILAWPLVLLIGLDIDIKV